MACSSPMTISNLARWLDHILSDDPAESINSSFSSSPGFSITLFHLVYSPISDPIRLAAAVHFKNLLRSHWDPLSEDPIPEHEKQVIRSLLLSFIVAAPQHIKPHLLDSLSVVSHHDFPHHWPTLLPDIANSLRSLDDDYPSINNLLSAADSLFRKLRHSFHDYAYSLNCCLDHFAASLLHTFLKTSRLIAYNVAGPSEVLCPLFECQRLCCEIFHSLNSVELPQLFKDHMDEWMTRFLAFFANSYSQEVEAEGTVDALRTAVCHIFQLFLHKKNDEDAFFNAYLSDFFSTLRTFLVSSARSPSHNLLTLTAIQFLTTVSTSVHHALFGSHHVISEICQSIVFPNIKISEELEELFVTNYLEYAKRDIGGSDIDSKRRIFCELLKRIAFNYKEPVAALMERHIENSRNLYCGNPAKYWKEKESCIYLVIALAPVMRDSSLGYLVDVDSFYTDFIASELEAQEVNSFPVLKASALKFFTVFRERIPDTEFLLRLGDLSRFLVSESNVVHSYAAKCIENVLELEDKVHIGGSEDAAYSPRYSAADINPFLPVLMQNLFSALKLPKSKENPYIMKCIVRVLWVGDITGDTAKICIFELSEVLADACKNPKNPTFNYYLLDVIDALIGDYRSENVPASVHMLKTFLQKVPIDLNDDVNLDKVVFIFIKLIAVPKTEELGFYVLNAVVENISQDALARCSVDIWTAIFVRLNTRRIHMFAKNLVIFLSLVLIKHGPDFLVQSVDSVKKDVFCQILDYFWIPYLHKISGPTKVKLASVAATRLICKSAVLLDPSNSELWGKLLDSIVTLLAQPAKEKADELVVVETMGYSSAFSHLHYAVQKEEDPLKEINDPKQVLVAALATLSVQMPGRYCLLIQTYLSPANQEALLQLCLTYNCAVV